MRAWDRSGRDALRRMSRVSREIQGHNRPMERQEAHGRKGEERAGPVLKENYERRDIA